MEKLFHAQTRHNSRKFQASDKILSYHLYQNKFQNQLSNPNEVFPDRIHAKVSSVKNFNDELPESYSTSQEQVNKFNNKIDSVHLPVDIQRPMATRYEVQSFYYDKQRREKDQFKVMSGENKDKYLSDYQFVPKTPTGDGTDFFGSGRNGGSTQSLDFYF